MVAGVVGGAGPGDSLAESGLGSKTGRGDPPKCRSSQAGRAQELA